MAHEWEMVQTLVHSNHHLCTGARGGQSSFTTLNKIFPEESLDSLTI